jgi:hypothetical protein
VFFSPSESSTSSGEFPATPRQSRQTDIFSAFSAASQKRTTALPDAEVERLILRYLVKAVKPLSEVESPEFRELLADFAQLKPEEIKWPSRWVITSRLETTFSQAKEDLKKMLSAVQTVCTTADGWSSRRRSYLGVTAHWLDPDTLRRRSAVLAMWRLLKRHTHDVLAAELAAVHNDFGLDVEKIVCTVTDSGSNFIKAFNVFGVAAEAEPEQSMVPDDDSSSDEDTAGSEKTEEVDDADEDFRAPLLIGDALEDHDDIDNFRGFDDDVQLPKHFRCMAHLLNLVSKTDVPSFVAKSG